MAFDGARGRVVETEAEEERMLARKFALVTLAVALAACGDDPVASTSGESLTVARFTTLENAAAQGTQIDTTRRRTTITDASAWTALRSFSRSRLRSSRFARASSTADSLTPSSRAIAIRSSRVSS